MAKKKRRPQRPKQPTRRHPYHIYDPNVMSHYRFALGDKDYGYDNWRPYRDRDEAITRSNYLNKSSGKSLLPKEGQKRYKNKYR
ncbi:MAG: hypothetical protein ACTSR2_06375 [Candidatus Hodarchaeales archaeon]